MHDHGVDYVARSYVNECKQNTDKECKEELLEISVPKSEHDARQCAADKFAVTECSVDKELSEKEFLKNSRKYSDGNDPYQCA